MLLAILIITTSNSKSQTIELKKENKVKILEKNLKKTGLQKNLKNIFSTVIHYETFIDNADGLKITGKVIFKEPNCFYHSEKRIYQKEMQLFITKFDGENCFVEREIDKTKTSNKISKELMNEKYILNNPFYTNFLFDNIDEVLSINKVKKNKKTVFELKINDNTSDSMLLYIDATSYFLIQKKIYKNNSLNSIHYSDFKTVEDFVIPHKETSNRYLNNKLAQTLNKKIVSVNFNVDVNDSIFK
tara:strand:- start:75 stop:806 length:732 start_codon:yes stop_codon:yes gene_type:complete